MWMKDAVAYFGGLPPTIQEDIRTIRRELERLFKDHPIERDRFQHHLEQAYAFQSYVVNNYTAACHDYGSTTDAYVTCYLEDEAFFEYPFHFIHACHWYYYEQNNIVANEDAIEHNTEEANKVNRNDKEEEKEGEELKKILFVHNNEEENIMMSISNHLYLANDTNVRIQPDLKCFTGHTPKSIECFLCFEKTIFPIQLNGCTHKMCSDCYHNWTNHLAHSNDNPPWCPYCKEIYNGGTMISWHTKKYNFRWSTLKKGLENLRKNIIKG